MASKYQRKIQRQKPAKPSSPKICKECGLRIRGSVEAHNAGSHHKAKAS